MSMSAITTHVLDTSLGRPATGVAVSLEQLGAAGWIRVAQGRTDSDGRIRRWGPERLPAGEYRLVFGTADYFAARGVETFYPQVTVTFHILDPEGHCHVPLLLAPFAYSTYRGS
jgi:5-hydroxyisourate hydrolase